jgi:hypothetical protein
LEVDPSKVGHRVSVGYRGDLRQDPGLELGTTVTDVTVTTTTTTNTVTTRKKYRVEGE